MALNEKKIVKKLTEILGLVKDLRMEYFDTFPEDATEDRVSWNELYSMATDDSYKIDSVKRELKKMLEDIDYFEYEDED